VAHAECGIEKTTGDKTVYLIDAGGFEASLRKLARAEGLGQFLGEKP